jgi:hypothetical protein
MRLSRRQLQMLSRYPRATRVWGRNGVRLASSTRVVVDGDRVRLVRRSNAPN